MKTFLLVCLYFVGIPACYLLAVVAIMSSHLIFNVFGWVLLAALSVLAYYSRFGRHNLSVRESMLINNQTP
jgi:hypothetical protein